MTHQCAVCGEETDHAHLLEETLFAAGNLHAGSTPGLYPVCFGCREQLADWHLVSPARAFRINRQFRHLLELACRNHLRSETNAADHTRSVLKRMWNGVCYADPDGEGWHHAMPHEATGDGMELVVHCIHNPLYWIFVRPVLRSERKDGYYEMVRDGTRFIIATAVR